MTAVAITSLLLAISLPSFSSARDALALTTESNKLVSALRAVQASARADHRDHRLIIDLDGHSYRSSSSRVSGEERLALGVEVSPKTTFKVRDGQIAITYVASGWGTPGTLWLRSSGGREKKLSIQVATGRVSLR